MKRTMKQKKEASRRAKAWWASLSKEQRAAMSRKISQGHRLNSKKFTANDTDGIHIERTKKADTWRVLPAGRKVELIYTPKYIFGMEDNKQVHLISER